MRRAASAEHAQPQPIARGERPYLFSLSRPPTMSWLGFGGGGPAQLPKAEASQVAHEAVKDPRIQEMLRVFREQGPEVRKGQR